jgi:type II secretory pathway predicted ATPase ExeA
LSTYLRDENLDVQNQELRLDPWTMEYIPELYIASEKLNSQIARLLQIIKDGKAICSIIGDIKSGKSYLLNLLRDGFKESLWKYSTFNKIHILFFDSEEMKDYSLTIFLQKIAEQVFGKTNHSREQIIVELKNYTADSNALLVLLLDNFRGNLLSSVASDSAKLLKLLKEHFSCIITCNLSEMMILRNGLKEGGSEHLSYSIHLPELSMAEAKELVTRRMSYALNQSNVQIGEIFSERALEAAWVESKGNPWVFISTLSDAYSFSKKKGSKIVSHDAVISVIDMFSRTPVQGTFEDHDKFIIQQALNNFPYRERQVCEYLIHKDATAKEITLYLYGELPPSEYRSKYMGTKSFLKRLKDKNVVVTKGQEGRSLLFGLNPKMRERLTQSNDKSESSMTSESKIYVT